MREANQYDTEAIGARAMCVVLQPFDNGGEFDQRYDGVLAPAILAAGLTPYRVDRDDAAEIPIDVIETRVRESAACICDITRDNPNVWFELGLALAYKKLVIIVCHADRTVFPFDVQHRRIIRYHTRSPEDFTRLQTEVTGALRARTHAEAQVRELAGPLGDQVSDSSQLRAHEVAALITIAVGSTSRLEPIRFDQVAMDMDRAGFTRVAARLAVRRLHTKDLIGLGQGDDRDYGIYDGYFATGEGLDWLDAHTDIVKLTHPEPDNILPGDGGDDIPF